MQNGSKTGLVNGAETDPKITTIPKILKNDKKSQKWPQNDQKLPKIMNYGDQKWQKIMKSGLRQT